ncbi:hypothetical protein Tco_0661492 [Tanacetum coccineum]
MANDDPILTTIRFIPQHEVVQRYGAILPDYLTNPAMKESEAYKTCHDLATGKVGSGAHEGTGVTPGVPDVPTYESDDEKISWKSSEEEDDDEENVKEGEEESFDPRVQTPSHVESTDDKDDDEEVQGVNIEGESMDEAANNEEDEGNELYRDMNVNLEGRNVEMTDD